MKKLTAGIFATILGVTAMGAADAAVTSKGYVDAAVGTVAQSVTNLGTTVSSHTTQINALNTNAATHATKAEVATVQGNVDTLAGKVGTLPEGTSASTVVGYVDEKTADIASSSTVSNLTTRVKTIEDDYITAQKLTESQNAQNTAITTAYQTADAATLKAAQDYADANDADTVYSDAEVRGLISGNTTLIQGLEANKADKSTTYTKTETDDLLGLKANSADVYTTTQADAKFLTSANLETYATKAEAKGYADAKDAAISAAQTAATAADGKAVAAQGTADDAVAAAAANAEDIVDLKAADATFELKANVSGAEEGTTTGKYVLTKIDDGQGNVSFGWELIDRDYVASDVTPNNQ